MRTAEAVITEAVYVLSSPAHYRLSHDEIRSRLAPIISLRGLKLPSKRVYLQALDVYATHPTLDFEDALTVAHMAKSGIRELYSYDTAFDRVPAVTRIEP